MLARLKAEACGCASAPTPGQSSAKRCSPGWASQTISSSSTPRRARRAKPTRGVPRSPRAAGRQRTRRRVVCEDAVYATRTARQCGFYLIDIEDETSAADQPELQRLADQYINGLDAAGLDKIIKQWGGPEGPPHCFIGTAFPDNLSAPCGLQAPARGGQEPVRRSASRTHPAASWDTAARLTT